MGLGSVQGPSRADHVKMDPGSRARPSLRRILARLGSPPRWGSFLIFLAAAWAAAAAWDFFVGVFLSRCWRACCCCWAWASSKARRESRASFFPAFEREVRRAFAFGFGFGVGVVVVVVVGGVGWGAVVVVGVGVG